VHNVLLRWFWLMLILHTTCIPSTLVKLIVFVPSSCLLLANLTMLSKYFNSSCMVNMVSIRDREIFPLMKWCSTLEWIVAFLLKSSTCFVSPSFATSTFSVSTCNLLLGILVLEKMSCLVPHNMFNCSKIAYSLFTKTSK